MASPLKNVPEPRVKKPNGLPNGRLLLETIGLTHERLNAGRKLKVKVAIPAQLLKELLTIAASTVPFDVDFYLSTYADIRSAYEAGRISDPRTHFIEEGYIEGRFASRPSVDEKYYTAKYKDVRAAISAEGGVSSALEHYVKAGAFEGRCPNSESETVMNRWMTLLGR